MNLEIKNKFRLYAGSDFEPRPRYMLALYFGLRNGCWARRWELKLP
jgi:hypothetical protein